MELIKVSSNYYKNRNKTVIYEFRVEFLGITLFLKVNKNKAQAALGDFTPTVASVEITEPPKIHKIEGFKPQVAND